MAWGNRWEWEHTRISTSGLLKLDVRALKRAGALRPGVVCSVAWGDGRSITVHTDRHGDCLTLDYKTRRHGKTEWTSRTDRVWLETTPCHYGGERVWFTCPGCLSRRAVLFCAKGIFRCRGCHDLAYTSTRQDAIDRGTNRIRALQRKLGAPIGFPIWRIPDKPAGMHWRTYDRLVFQLRIAMAGRNALFGAKAAALLQRADQLLAERELVRRRLHI
jgi:hypothetical protein